LRRPARAPGLLLGGALSLLAGALVLLAGCDAKTVAAVAPPPAAAASVAPAPHYDRERRNLDAAIEHGRALVASRPEDGLLPLEVVTLLLERARLTGDYADFGRARELLDARAPSAGAAASHCLLRARLDYTLHRLKAAQERLAACPPGVEASERAGLAADIALYGGRYREAEATYRALANEVGTPAQFVRLGLLRAKTGAPAEAAALLEAAERRYHGSSATMKAWLRLQRGLVALDRGRLDEALALYRQSADELPGWWLVDEHVAEVQALRGDKAAARALYASVVERTGAPEFLDALAALEDEAGDKASAAGRRAQARALYEKRLADHPEAAAGHALDHFLADPSATGRALALAQANHATRPFGDSAIALARAWLHAGQPARAAPLLEAELAKGWDTAEIHWVLGAVREALGQKARAQAARGAALARNPHAAAMYGAP
jgi:Tfp pilus assembly protein PilF